MATPTGWAPASIHAGLQDLERIRRQVDAATAALVGALPDDRDAMAGLVRSLGLSTREARRRRDVAAVAGAVPAAAALLAAGSVSAEHVAALLPMIGDPAVAAEVVAAAAATGQSPEDVARAVRQHRLDQEHGSDSVRRQRALRSLRFFTGPEGMVGLNALLPSIEGATLKALIDGIVNRKWHAEHPERARVLGGHGGDSREQRAADALLELAGIEFFDSPRASDESGGDCGPDAGEADDNVAGHRHAAGSGSAGGWEARTSADAAGSEGGADEEGGGETGGSAGGGRSPQAATVGSVLPGRRAVPTGRATAKPPRPTVVIVFDIDRYRAEMLGVGPVPVTPSLFDLAKADLYYSFVNMHGEVLKFGRARRDPTPLQRIAVLARDRTCFYPGCSVPATECEVHHINEWLLDHGFTDVDVLVASCKAHHGHVHLEALVAERARDGTVTIRQRATGIVVAIASPRRRPAAAA